MFIINSTVINSIIIKVASNTGFYRTLNGPEKFLKAYLLLNERFSIIGDLFIFSLLNAKTV